MNSKIAHNDTAFMDWLGDLVGESPEAMSAYREEMLEIRLADALKAARSAAGMPQAMVSEASGLKQSVVSRLEKPDHNATLQSIIRYLDALGADLVLTVVLGNRSFPATDLAERTVTFPAEVAASADAQGLTLKEYVLSCLAAGRSIENVTEAIQESIRSEMDRQFQDMRRWVQDSPSEPAPRRSLKGYFTDKRRFGSDGADDLNPFLAAA